MDVSVPDAALKDTNMSETTVIDNDSPPIEQTTSENVKEGQALDEMSPVNDSGISAEGAEVNEAIETEESRLVRENQEQVFCGALRSLTAVLQMLLSRWLTLNCNVI